MLFLNPWLLAGLIGATIPVIIHLVRQQAAKPVEWGAMRFLFDTISVRRRRMEWEDLLLMAARCLLLGLLALALARPFIPPDSNVPWLFVLPAGLLGIALLGGSFVLGNAKARWIVRGTAIALLIGAAGLVLLEKYLNLKRFEASGRRDVALVIDASASMELTREGKTVFQHAIEEARQLVKEAPNGTAFSVILGGPAPEARTAAPLTHRADVLGVLDKLEPVGGTFRAHDALGMATLGLAQGTNASKEIVVFTDSQRSGWRFENPSAWDGLENAWKAMPSKPKLLLRNFGAPDPFRNVALSSMELSRALVGTDRELVMRVTVENSGSVAITPGPVTMEIEGKKAGESPVGLLVPGQTETVEFRHRFTGTGPQVIEARIDAKDDLASDNRIEHVVTVREKLSVLLVDGNPAGSFFDRAAGYSALALAPSTGLIGGERAGDKFLMDPRVVSASNLSESDLDDAAVIILADVPRLPAAIATRLAAKIAEGNGLIVIAGPRAESAFYNSWESMGGPLLPLPLGDEAVDATGISPAASTFVHESLKLFGKKSDIEAAGVKRWRKTGKPAEGAVQAAAFSNGDAFLATRSNGNGRCVLATCAFDARAGNLPAKRAFVPLLHELVTWAAGGGVDLNVASAWSPEFILNSGSGGLSATYYRSMEKRDKVGFQRIDPAIDFDWKNDSPGKGMPDNRFSVEWKGSLIPPISGGYFIEAEADDQVDVKIGDRFSLQGKRGDNKPERIALEAGKPVPITVNFQEDGGEASVHLYWTPPGDVRQVIPSSAFQPAKSADSTLKTIDPRGLPRQATIQAGRRGRELTIDGPALPGIYRVSTGTTLDGVIPGIRNGSLPVAVSRDAGESRFETMTGDDIALVRKRIDLLLPKSVADLLGVLQGKGFGREIWKMLAVSAFILFLIESVLARWVSKSRRTAEDVRVEFGESTIWRGGR
ncbi:MAG: PA14 domain-containing protein [Luteolibacter sp.]|uniref:PA14 domain-containing protein n=1 Tax=Luteolibacter sp. TaxID=1962973 RepID=UPI0032662F3C